MELHLFEDNIAAGQEVTFSDTVARAIYVTAGKISTDGQDIACDDGLVADGPVTLVAGPEGASLWRWDLSDTDQQASTHRVAHKLSGSVPDALAISESFLRLDSVAFPPAGTAMLHTHQGPGIRCLRQPLMAPVARGLKAGLSRFSCKPLRTSQAVSFVQWCCQRHCLENHPSTM
jgi:hypothetical protein